MVVNDWHIVTSGGFWSQDLLVHFIGMRDPCWGDGIGTVPGTSCLWGVSRFGTDRHSAFNGRLSI